MTARGPCTGKATSRSDGYSPDATREKVAKIEATVDSAYSSCNSDTHFSISTQLLKIPISGHADHGGSN